MRPVSEKYVDLGKPRRVWAVASINGDHDRLITLHDHLATRFCVRDRLVYLGNYVGLTAWDNHAVLSELLAFRSALLSKPGMEAQDIVHLRGPAEESWQRLLRLQFAPSPKVALERYIESGVEGYLRLYGVSMNDTRSIVRGGNVAITRWTNQLRVLQRQGSGHEAFACSLRRAAVTTENDGAFSALFVPAGYDFTKSLEEQSDKLWYGCPEYNLAANQHGFTRMIRGFDPSRGGVATERSTVTLDANCGQGGPLVCGCFNDKGDLLELIAVGGKGAIETSRFEDVTRFARPSVTSDVAAQPSLFWQAHATA